ncbi:MAG: GTP-sensing pleiotropic transcriptional regulator CodY, partial [Lachnospiraceae bacterium]|nr:GTP-sensing pleiotropic transcriptional regulator CodY [Lachnospiraceae bacterium]
MSVELLDKTRKINKLLHNNRTSKVLFNDICQVMTEILDSDVIIISQKGKVLGIGETDKFDLLNELLNYNIGERVDDSLNERLLSILSTQDNVYLSTLGFSSEASKAYKAIIIPINIAGERLGTTFVYRQNNDFQIDDIIICEYGTTVVGLEMLRSVHEESAEEIRKEGKVQSAISTLSYSELEAIIYIFDELSKNEGTIVASKVADRAG